MRFCSVLSMDKWIFFVFAQFVSLTNDHRKQKRMEYVISHLTHFHKRSHSHFHKIKSRLASKRQINQNLNLLVLANQEFRGIRDFLFQQNTLECNFRPSLYNFFSVHLDFQLHHKQYRCVALVVLYYDVVAIFWSLMGPHHSRIAVHNCKIKKKTNRFYTISLDFFKIHI